MLGTGKGRGVGALKKLYGARHLRTAFGCDVVWVMDCESLPMRTFSFAEVFSRLGKIWVGDSILMREARSRGDVVGALAANKRRSAVCAANAQGIHKLDLSSRVQNMDLRQNDFWLYETRLLDQVMAGALRGLPPNAGFLDAWMQGGKVSEQLLWNSWLAQRILDGKLPGHTAANYTLTTITQTSGALRRCFANASARSWAGDELLKEAALAGEGFSWAEFGRYWYEDLGQAAIWGDYLFNTPLEPGALRDFVASVPWCVSNCHRPPVQRLLAALDT